MKNILKPRGTPRILTSFLVLAAVSAAAFAGWALGKRGWADWAEKTGGKIDKEIDHAKEAAEDLIGEDGPVKRAGRKVDEALE